jgi:hypothetical protein
VLERVGEMEREVKMNVDANGRKRLEAMKKALAAGVPLAGLLAGMACATDAVAGNDYRTMGAPMPTYLQKERKVEEQRPPRGYVPPNALERGEEWPRDPMGEEKPERPKRPGKPIGAEEKATGSLE